MGLLDEAGEYLRRSGRNLGGLFDWAGSELPAWLAGGAQAGADPLMALYRGDAADQPFLPTADSGGRIGAIASAVTNHAIPGTMPAGALGTYGGIGAKTANKAQLAKAQSAIKGGMDPEDARQQFGWFQDPTGDWKFEISDHKAQLKQDKAGNWKLHHAELERAYPGMVKDLKISPMPAKNSLGEDNPLMGLYLKDTNTAKLNEGLLADPEEATKTLIHELQHGVQFKEGFSPGTNPVSDEVKFKVNTEQMPKWHALHEREGVMRNQRNDWLASNKNGSIEDFYKQNPEWTAEYDDLLKRIREHPSYNDMTHNTYESAMGEVEARDTMNRLRLTPDQRQRIPPYRYMGVDDHVPPDQIWDVRDVRGRLYPKKAADEAPSSLGALDPPELRGLLTSPRLTPEQKGMLGSLLGIGLLPDDAE